VLIHFKSRDLANLHRQGQFWHTFFPSDPAASGGSLGGAIVSQDEVDTWTVHDFLTPGSEQNALSAEETIYRVLGGMGDPYQIDIDEIIVQSTYRPTVAVAKAYSGPQHHVFLAGDSCHQTIPSGGYGMNMGLADAFDLGWKLAARVQGWGGPQLLASYEAERRPVAELMLHWGKVHGGKLLGLPLAVKLDASIIDSPDARGQELRAAIDKYVQTNDGHNQSFGVEMGYRYQSRICVASKMDTEVPPPQFDPRSYIPTTHPGYRAPHVFLRDGTAIFDKFGKEFTLVEFSEAMPDASGSDSKVFEDAAMKQSIPLKVVSLVGESHASQIWAARLVLVRPDGFVSWHGHGIDGAADAEQILLQATGHI
jgi:FAD-dependent monooxygenase